MCLPTNFGMAIEPNIIQAMIPIKIRIIAMKMSTKNKNIMQLGASDDS